MRKAFTYIFITVNVSCHVFFFSFVGARPSPHNLSTAGTLVLFYIKQMMSAGSTASSSEGEFVEVFKVDDGLGPLERIKREGIPYPFICSWKYDSFEESCDVTIVVEDERSSRSC